MILTDFRRTDAPQGVENHRHPIPSAAFLYTAQKSRRGLRHIHRLKLAQAVGTVSAVIGTILAEIAQNICPEAVPGEAVKGHLL